MGRAPVYFEAAAAITSLMRLVPKTARRINADETEQDLPIADVHVGDRLRAQRVGSRTVLAGIVNMVVQAQRSKAPMQRLAALTEGNPRFERSVAASGYGEDDVLRLAGGLDQGSEHPLAAAIVTDALRSSGASVMYLAVDRHLAGFLALSDPIKAGTAEALQGLKAAGIRVLMATGDGPATALTTPRHLPRPTSAWRWVPVPTSR
jgi:cation transport ATPase